MLHKYTYAPLAMMLALSAQTNAADSSDHMLSFAYLNVPLGATTRTQSEPTYGFAVSSGNKHNDLFSSKRPRLFDMSFKNNQLEDMQVHGLSALEKHITHNADGTTSTTMGINTGLLAGGIVAGAIAACAGELICDDNDNNNAAPPDPEGDPREEPN